MGLELNGVHDLALVGMFKFLKRGVGSSIGAGSSAGVGLSNGVVQLCYTSFRGQSRSSRPSKRWRGSSGHDHVVLPVPVLMMMITNVIVFYMMEMTKGTLEASGLAFG